MKWEYKTELIHNQTIHRPEFGPKGENFQQRTNKILAELGNEGWELVSTTKKFTDNEMLLIFKRPI